MTNPGLPESHMLIDEFMPQFRLRQVDRIRIKAPPDEAWPIVRGLDTYELPISRFLFNLRTFPDRLFKRFRGERFERVQHSRIEDFTGPTKEFKILVEAPGREIVIGSVGKFWKLNIPFVQVTPDEFPFYNLPGYAKLAWNLRLDPDAHGGSWLTWELRVTTTDNESWKTFRKYWYLIGKFSHLLRRTAMKQFKKKLGQVEEEELRLPGDSIIASPKFQRTMSTTIDAKPQDIWPWLVQMGCRRAGWYSIDRLDNGGIKSAERIIPELQNIKVGDVLPWRPKGNEGFTVHALDETHSLVLSSAPIGAQTEKLPISDSWAFVLEPIGPTATRLITRVRGQHQPSFKMAFMTKWLGVAHFIMEKAQLKNLKQRVEHHGA